MAEMAHPEEDYPVKSHSAPQLNQEMEEQRRVTTSQSALGLAANDPLVVEITPETCSEVQPDINMSETGQSETSQSETSQSENGLFEMDQSADFVEANTQSDHAETGSVGSADALMET